jgi:hypothetical protein
MPSSNYPPGHPTGTISTVTQIECPDCGTDCTIHCDYERDTNATIIDDAYCEKCKHDFTEDELEKSDWEDPYEPDWDAIYDMQKEDGYID